ncbi:50S ribosomal protein L4 [Patescibacteria group bacterium]|nr:50S ribosomal protein L4 [Patescibacteria group bacterium]
MLKNIKVYNQKAEVIEEAELPVEIFGLKMNEGLIHQMVVADMANKRQVLAHTKGRAEVSGGGKKPWKQKGTGRARAGSSRSPIWVGGGVTFGPTKDRNFKKLVNKKMKVKALLCVLSDKVKSDNFTILDKIELKEYKTKVLNDVIGRFESQVFVKEDRKKKRSILIINNTKDSMAKRSASNLVGVEMINVDNINIIDLLKFKYLLITKESLDVLKERYSK